jgi:hypothetical protein
MGRYNYYCSSYSKYYVEDGKWYLITFYLLLTYLQSVLFICSPMDLDMYKHPSSYFKALHEFGNTIIPAESGELASGLSGRKNGRTFNYS